MLSNKTTKPTPRFTKTILSTIIGLASMGAYAAENTTNQAGAEQKEEIEVISISGMRESYLNAMNTKRTSANVVDSISLKDIGALPDNSVAETLERITGVSADRYKGGASEISIRGLGPFLGMSTINGRAISSGSGNRSVAFSQFPSELVNGVTVYKSQSANLLEGGVSGTVDLGTIRPVDNGKEQLQVELKGSYNDYQAKQNGDNGLGHKLSFSYVNSYDVADGKLGFAIGYAGGETPRPEDTYVSSSTLRPCNSDYLKDGGSDCSFKNTNKAANGGAPEDGDYYFISNMQNYRQMESTEDNDAVIAALQWKPNEQFDINLDAQWSERFFYEDRHDLTFDDGRRKIHNWVTDENHVLQSYSGETRIGNTNEYRGRNEEYTGFGANVKWQVNEDLSITADAAFSGTERYQDRTFVRFRSKRKYFNWEKGAEGDFPNITVLDGKGGDPVATISEDIKSLAFYNDDSEARKYRSDVKDEITSFKLNAEQLIDHDIFKTIRAGLSISSHDYQGYAEIQATAKPTNKPLALTNATDLCSGTWPQKDYGDDANTPFTEWAKIDTLCAYNVVLENSSKDSLTANAKAPSQDDTILTEDITSLYLMSDFEYEFSGMYLTGNLGLRYVQTDIASKRILQDYTSSINDDGFVELQAGDVTGTKDITNSFNHLLPSLNMTLEVSDELGLRLAAYQAVSRPDMWFYGAGTLVNLDDDKSKHTTVESALTETTTQGNAHLELLESDNLELGVNWYFTEESMFSVALYNKTFSASLGYLNTNRDITVDGTTYNDFEISNLPSILDGDSSINGVELSLVHQFVTLPAPFNGLGFSGSYNYADSDYETPERGSLIPDSVSEQVTPGNLPGLSEHVANAQLYWEGDSVSARIAYKYRSEYLKPFGDDLGQTNRFVEDQKSVDLSLGYKINKNFKVKAQLMNLTNEPAVQYRVAPGAYNQIEHGGRKVFLSVKYKM